MKTGYYACTELDLKSFWFSKRTSKGLSNQSFSLVNLHIRFIGKAILLIT